MLVLVAGLAGGAILQGPAILKARVKEAASRAGINLAVDRVELSRGGLSLTGVKASLVGVPGARLVAPDALAVLSGGSVERIMLSSYDLSVSGTATQLAEQIGTWTRGAHAPLTVDGRNGHVLWLPRGTAALEALDATFSLSPDATLTVDSPSLLVTLPRGHLGPWHAHLDIGAQGTRARVGLDPSQPQGAPAATYVDRRLEGATWALDIPRGSTFKIGVPGQFFGVASDLALEASIRAQVSPKGDAVSAEGQIGVYGLPIATGHGADVPVDLLVSGSIAGDPGKPMPINGGKLVLGKVTTPVSGSVEILRDGVKASIDRPESVHRSPVPAFVLDTREWTGAEPAK
jgi:hypothetical protein